MITPTVTRVGTRWKLSTTGLEANQAITISVLSHQVTVTQNGNSAQVAIPDAATLTPGTGWTGETSQPAAVGDSEAQAYDRMPMARWTTNSNQTVTTTKNFGVKAYHFNGTGKVSFSLDDGPWEDVDTPTVNPETGLTEYWVKLDAILCMDGPHELRFIAYPVSGVPRVGQGTTSATFFAGTDQAYTTGGSLIVFTNHGGTLTSPVVYVSETGAGTKSGADAANASDSIKSAMYAIASTGSYGGGTIYLLAGSYAPEQTAFASQNPYGANGHYLDGLPKRFITITPAVGVAKSAVTITGYTTPSDSPGSDVGYNLNALKLQGLMMTGWIHTSQRCIQHTWMDDVTYTGGSMTDQTLSQPNDGMSYESVVLTVTNSDFSYLADCWSYFDLIRNCNADHIGQSVVRNTRGWYGGRVTNNFFGDDSYHPDTYVMTGNLPNSIVSEVDASSATNKVWSLQTHTVPNYDVVMYDVAITDSVWTSTDVDINWERANPFQNWLIIRCTFNNGLTWNDDIKGPDTGSTHISDMLFEDCTFRDPPVPHSGVTVR